MEMKEMKIEVPKITDYKEINNLAKCYKSI